ncbi:hypothetical protein NDU88_002973 [Pleurodeles waltl]|uniref:Uncharacterized protein n=1 Tax=Pleurodeles waltl TaxID=8319 RepID=A0AAV7PAY8_PLEWA|nr:hypothetical protein NDU88_002973 [Pleurodeles waltl]
MGPPSAAVNRRRLPASSLQVNLAICGAVGTRSHDNVLPIVGPTLGFGPTPCVHSPRRAAIAHLEPRSPLSPNPLPPPSPGLRAAKQWGAPSGGLGRSTVHSPDRAVINPRKALPWDRSVSSALLTSGRCSDPARPEPRALPRLAATSTGSPSLECVAAESSDLRSRTLPMICYFRPRGWAAIPALWGLIGRDGGAR